MVNPRAAPAMQHETEVLQVLHLPRKTSRRCSKCCPCHTKRPGAQSNQLSPDLRGPLWRCSKCCTCHAKRAEGAPSAAPATQNDPAPDFRGPLNVLQVLQVLHLPREIKLDWGAPATQNDCRWTSGGAPSAAHATQNKMSLRCSKCRTCHAKRSGAQSNQSSPAFRGPLWRCSKCCACHAKRAWDAPSAAPATQKTNLRCSKCCTCHANRSGAQSNQSSPAFGWPLRRCSKNCACHAKRAWDAPSAAPATQNEAEVLQVLRWPRKTKRRPK